MLILISRVSVCDIYFLYSTPLDSMTAFWSSTKVRKRLAISQCGEGYLLSRVKRANNFVDALPIYRGTPTELSLLRMEAEGFILFL